MAPWRANSFGVEAPHEPRISRRSFDRGLRGWARIRVLASSVVHGPKACSPDIGTFHEPARSAGCQPAVSPTSSRQVFVSSGALGPQGGSQVGSLRYGRLEVCATPSRFMVPQRVHRTRSLSTNLLPILLGFLRTVPPNRRAQPVPHHFDGIAALPDQTITLSLGGLAQAIAQPRITSSRRASLSFSAGPPRSKSPPSHPRP